MHSFLSKKSWKGSLTCCWERFPPKLHLVFITNHLGPKRSLNHHQRQARTSAKYESVYLTSTPVPTTLELRPCSRCHLTSGKELSINWLLLDLPNNWTLLNEAISFIEITMEFGLLFLCGYVKTGYDEIGWFGQQRLKWKVCKMLLTYQPHGHVIRLFIITIDIFKCFVSHKGGKCRKKIVSEFGKSWNEISISNQKKSPAHKSTDTFYLEHN